MNATHALIVNQFRAGAPIPVLAERFGFAPNSIYRILRGNDAPAAKARRRAFQSRPDGEYVECRGCVRRGYGEDAWHPATAEFWRTMDGRLYFAQCRACLCDSTEHKHGVVPGRMAA